MKKKEVFIIIISLTVMGVALYFLVQMLFPPTENTYIEKEADKIPTVASEFDEDTYKKIEDLSDYGLPALENIGKSDLFAN